MIRYERLFALWRQIKAPEKITASFYARGGGKKKKIKQTTQYK